MDLLKTAIDWMLHLDKHLVELVDWAGPWSYAVLFGIVFAETGLVVTPFLPGDSLLFAAGAISALEGSDLKPIPLAIVLFAAAVIGDTVNYWIGGKVGAKVFEKDHRFIKREHLEKTKQFYEKYGAKTIVIARFVPIVRTFAPFVAGVGSMRYRTFLFYNIAGGAVWVISFVAAGYYFGNLPFVRKNFTLVIFAIIVISILPIVIEFVKARRARAAGTG